MADVIVAMVILAIVGGAIWYIRKEKRKGVQCIGCPSAGACSRKTCGSSECGCDGGLH